MLLSARLAGIAALTLGMVSLAPAAESPPKLELRRAETKPAEGLTEAKVAGSDEKVYLRKEAEVTEKDVTQAQAVEHKGTFVIEIVLTKEGQKKLAKLTEEHVDKPLAILVDGKVIAAPVVRDKVPGEKAIITGNFTKEEAEKIAKGIKDK